MPSTAFCPMSRSLLAAFLILIALTALLWSYRFDRESGCATVRLSDLQSSLQAGPASEWNGNVSNPVLILHAPPAGQNNLQTFNLPNIPMTGWLHIRCKAGATGLTVGPQPWSDGRLIIEWQHADGTREFDPVVSVRDNQTPEELEVCCRPRKSPATPVLRLEHLGSAGDYTISRFDATAVRESSVWAYGKWALLTAWVCFFCTSRESPLNHPGVRRTAAGGIWLAMALAFVLPGPWKSVRPLGTSFSIDNGKVNNNAVLLHPPTDSARPQSATILPKPKSTTSHAGDLRPKTPLLYCKDLINRYCASIKPLFHIPLLLFPTWFCLWLVGTRPTVFFAVLTSVSIEMAQLAFGYSLDWQDALDLCCDAIGIFLALRIWRWSTYRMGKSKALNN